MPTPSSESLQALVLPVAGLPFFTDAVSDRPFSQPHVMRVIPGHAAQCTLASFALSRSHRLVCLVRVCSWCTVNMQLADCCSVRQHPSEVHYLVMSASLVKGVCPAGSNRSLMCAMRLPCSALTHGCSSQ